MSAGSKFPSVYYLLFSYVAGLLLHRVGLLLLLPALTLLCMRAKQARGLGLCLLAVCIGAANVELTDPLRDPRHYRNAGLSSYVALELCQNPEERVRSFRAKAKVVATGNDTIWRQRSGYVQCYFLKDSAGKLPRYGDKIMTGVSLRPIDGFIGKDSVFFDYGAFMAQKGIHAQVFLYPDDFTVVRDGRLSFWNRFKRAAGGLRSELHSFWEDCALENRELAVAKALILGERGTDPIEEAYRKSGIIHVLAVSGMHLSVFACMAAAVFSFLRRKAWQRWLRFVLVLMPVWGYAVLTGLYPSVFRAAYMFTIVGLGECMARKVKTTRSLAISAFIILVVSPTLLKDIGFLLSYTAVLGLTLFTPLWSKGKKPANRILRFFKNLTVASVSAQVATLPIALCVFGTFPTYFLLGNCLVAPLVNIALPLGIVVSLLSLIWRAAAEKAAFLLDTLLRFMNFMVEKIARLPAAVADLSISSPAAVLLYGVVASCWVAVKKRSAPMLRYTLVLLLLFLWVG